MNFRVIFIKEDTHAALILNPSHEGKRIEYEGISFSLLMRAIFPIPYNR
jgi:hypothetical protein